jgi:hypothetical protein
VFGVDFCIQFSTHGAPAGGYTPRQPRKMQQICPKWTENTVFFDTPGRRKVGIFRQPAAFFEAVVNKINYFIKKRSFIF